MGLFLCFHDIETARFCLLGKLLAYVAIGRFHCVCIKSAAFYPLPFYKKFTRFQFFCFPHFPFDFCFHGSICFSSCAFCSSNSFSFFTRFTIFLSLILFLPFSLGSGDACRTIFPQQGFQQVTPALSYFPYLVTILYHAHDNISTCIIYKLAQDYLFIFNLHMFIKCDIIMP